MRAIILLVFSSLACDAFFAKQRHRPVATSFYSSGNGQRSLGDRHSRSTSTTNVRLFFQQRGGATNNDGNKRKSLIERCGGSATAKKKAPIKPPRRSASARLERVLNIQIKPRPTTFPAPIVEETPSPASVEQQVTTPEDSEPLTVTSATALVAGTTVGAGILALPAFCIKAGFLPSSLILIGAWLYMVTTGLLIAEVNLNMAKSHRPDGGLISMAKRTIGDIGANAAGAAYLFLHYALLIAYIAQGGDILTQGAEAVFNLSNLPRQIAPILFTGVLGGALAFGKKKVLDQANDALVGVVVLAFLGLVALALPKADPSALLHQDWGAVPSAVPVMFVALVFHNIVPVISYRLDGDAGKIKQSIVVGTGIPLLMFLTWNAVVLGSIGTSIIGAAAAGGGGMIDPLEMLRKGGAGDVLGKLISLFSEVAIITSFTGFVYGLKDFFKDALFQGTLAKSGTRHLNHNQDLLAYGLILGPPLAVAITSPDIFFSALENAGVFGICSLFGIIPAIMAGIVRYRGRDDADYLTLVPGGYGTLGIVGAIAAGVIAQKAVALLG